MTEVHAVDIARGLKPLAHLSHPREVIRQFTPNWFAATMGTGVLALALAQFPVFIHNAATLPMIYGWRQMPDKLRPRSKLPQRVMKSISCPERNK